MFNIIKKLFNKVKELFSKREQKVREVKKVKTQKKEQKKQEQKIETKQKRKFSILECRKICLKAELRAERIERTSSYERKIAIVELHIVSFCDYEHKDKYVECFNIDSLNYTEVYNFVSELYDDYDIIEIANLDVILEFLALLKVFDNQ